MAFFKAQKIKQGRIPIPDVPPYVPTPVPTPESGTTPNIPRPSTDIEHDTTITFFIITDDAKTVYKDVSNVIYTCIGDFKEDTDVLKPTIIIESSVDLTECNYIYISKFRRFYFVNVKLLTGELYEVNGVVDALSTWRNQFSLVPCIIDREEKKNNLYINDGIWVHGEKNYTKVYNYTGGFNDTSDNILICAGGQ